MKLRQPSFIDKKTRICDLPLINVTGRLQKYEEFLAQELQQKGIVWRPHLWVSDEWFSPEGVPGFALPFYLFHPKLMRMEKQEVGLVEGASEYRRKKLMRHELGHAIENAFALSKNKERQKLFGLSEKKYPQRYLPKLYSKKFVNYLGEGYAQSHPDEDFAETFAAWLDPNSDWQKRYQGTPAFKKLVFMDLLMTSLKDQKPKLKNRFCIEPYATNKETLSRYYAKRRQQLRLNKYHFVDFSYHRHLRPNTSVAAQTLVHNYLSSNRKLLAVEVARRTGEYKYIVDRAINIIIKRAENQRWKAAEQTLEQASYRLVQHNLQVLKEKRLLDYYL